MFLSLHIVHRSGSEPRYHEVKPALLHQRNPEAVRHAILQTCSVLLWKLARTPMETNLQLEKSMDAQHLEKPYRELIGCLTHLVVTSRLDLSAALAFFSQFQCNLSELHWGHVKGMFRYLKGTVNFGFLLCFVYYRLYHSSR